MGLVYKLMKYGLRVYSHFFYSPLVSAGVMIVDKDKILMVRSYKPYTTKGGAMKGYSIPGGLVKRGEALNEAAIRETKEETGLDVEITDLFGIYSDPNRDPVAHSVFVVYNAKVVGGELRSSNEGVPEYVDLKKFKIPEVLDNNKGVLYDYFNKKKTIY